MSEKEWEKFFELIGKIVDESKPATEKAAEVLRQAGANDATANFEEFTSWFDG